MKPTKFYSNAQESSIASALGWQVVAGSGAAPCTPGDVIGDRWLGECKTHTSNAKSIYFNHDVWIKIKDEAMMKHRKPVLFTDDGTQQLTNTWCVCLSNSLESTGTYSIPINLTIRKNISFNHPDQLAAYRRCKGVVPEAFKDAHLVFCATWGGDSVVVMPFTTFQKIVEEQG